VSTGGSKLVIYGAGGHGLVVAEAAAASGWEVAGFCDDDETRVGTTVGGWPVLPKTALDGLSCGGHVAIGDNAARQRIVEQWASQPRRLISIVHPSAWVSPSATVGDGVYIGAQAVVNAQAEIRDGSIINSAAVVEHHCVVGPFAHVGPGVATGAGVTVGTGTLIGVGASLRPRVAIGAGCVVGVGAAVVSDVPDGQTVAGVPAVSRGPGL